MTDLRFLAILMLCVPGMSFAEGAAQEVDCGATRVCDAVGQCTASDDHVRFRLEPVDVGPEGIGSYTITYGEISARAEKLALLGPILWREAGDDFQSLIQDGPTGMLWHRFAPGGSPDSQVIFLTCEVVG